MKTSLNGIKFIEGQEGTILHLYNDEAGNATVGTGHLVHNGPVGTNPIAEEPYKNGITKAINDDLLAKDLVVAETEVTNHVKITLSQNQFDCLIDFVFNEGSGKLNGSTLLIELNQGYYDSVPVQLKRWVYSGGKIIGDLIRRRNAEAELWNTK